MKATAAAERTRDLMAEVGRIRILTRRLLDEQLSGDYHSVFKGNGIEFDEARPYQPGDDVRAIDWNVTARTGTPYIKRFSEERELTVLFLVDVSGSQSFGTGARSKAERAAELAALLAMTALNNQDKVGLITFSNRVHLSLPPRKGRTAVQRLVREVLAAEETREGTDLAAALRGRRVDGGLDRGGVVGDAVALRAEVAYIHGGEQRSGRAERDEEGKRFNEFHGGIIVDSAIPGKRTGIRDGRRGWPPA